MHSSAEDAAAVAAFSMALDMASVLSVTPSPTAPKRRTSKTCCMSNIVTVSTREHAESTASVEDTDGRTDKR